MRQIGRIKTLKLLALNGNPGDMITDQGLSHLRSLSDLEELSLYQMPITDEGLKSMSHFRHLKSLTLSFTRIEDPACRIFGIVQTLNTFASTVPRQSTTTEAPVSRSHVNHRRWPDSPEAIGKLAATFLESKQCFPSGGRSPQTITAEPHNGCS